MSQITQVSPATLYLDGVPIGTCEMSLPTLPPPASVPLATSYIGTFRLKSGKKTRRLSRALRELHLSKGHRAYIQHYRRVKQHQLRKRLLTKRP